MSDDRPSDGDGYEHALDHEDDDVRAARDRERTTDAVDRTERDAARSRDARAGVSSDERLRGSASGRAASGGTSDGGHGDGDDDGSGGRSDRIAFWLSALFGLALAVGAVALVTGRAPFFENVLRVRPTVDGGGVGADWLVGNTRPILEAAIAIVHFADVVMGIFILLMVFIHWAAFRRLGARMRPPAGSTRAPESAAATDGGAPESTGDGDSSRETTDDTTAADGGDRP
ncbi:hypothetical protein [Haloterrigena alkaliphila]|uniref:Uncharacterized protein n=1 Tax=Haloterrigena alkaliphila TaxID=2816475 RepID=A0A8A2VDH7_9EURY|nr:hypothetical protein [Haloterrigena alkaliphila]QSW99286.1 hypothetical protein J0X25_18240 [Haloterrigena alkaliphila]